MAYDEHLAARVRRALAPIADVDERKMFGGLAFLIRGHMGCGIIKDELMLRVGAEGAAAALAAPYARPLNFTGRRSKGMIVVAKAGVAGEAELRHWLDRATAYVATLPTKGRGKGKALVRRLTKLTPSDR